MTDVTTLSPTGLLTLLELPGVGSSTAEGLAQSFATISEIQNAPTSRLQTFIPERYLRMWSAEGTWSAAHPVRRERHDGQQLPVQSVHHHGFFGRQHQLFGHASQPKARGLHPDKHHRQQQAAVRLQLGRDEQRQHERFQLHDGKPSGPDRSWLILSTMPFALWAFGAECH